MASDNTPPVGTIAHNEKSHRDHFSSVDHISRLPLEILFLIFAPFRPVYQEDLTWAERKEFFRLLKFFADLRLLCKTWNHAFTPFLFQEIVVFTTPFPLMRKFAKVFEYGAPHVRTVIISGSKSPLPQYVEELLGRSLAMCPNIRRLECCGSHYTFTSRDWLINTAPRLADTVKSVVFYGNELSLSRCLRSLGHSLESLEIRYGDTTPETPTTFRLPPAFPHLSEVIILEGPSMQSLEKLLARIIKTTPGKTPKVPLRSLHFQEVFNLHQPDVLKLLNINRLSSCLTSLSIEFFLGEWEYDPQFPITIAKACPSLVDFTYLSVADVGIFDAFHLPMERLRLLLPVEAESSKSQSCVLSSVDDFVGYLESSKARSLKNVSLVVHKTRHEFNELLLEGLPRGPFAWIKGRDM